MMEPAPPPPDVPTASSLREPCSWDSESYGEATCLLARVKYGASRQWGRSAVTPESVGFGVTTGAGFGSSRSTPATSALFSTEVCRFGAFLLDSKTKRWDFVSRRGKGLEHGGDALFVLVDSGLRRGGRCE